MRLDVHMASFRVLRQFSPAAMATTSFYTRDESLFDNNILRYLVVMPACLAIHDVRSIRELLEALRDAIKAHKSLVSMEKDQTGISRRTTL